jgi:Cap4 SAVED domain
MEFEVLIDESFTGVSTEALEGHTGNKHVLSLINDFEGGGWRFQKFRRFIWDNIAETALTVRERAALSTQAGSLLGAAAQKLRLTDQSGDVGQGSELAEIVLYGIMRRHYKALSVVPKIFHKQNVQDNAKGADSVHIVVTGTDEFSLWMGEAKFYSSIDDVRLQNIVDSVGNSLKPDKLKKENSIITNVSDLSDLKLNPALERKIRESLDKTRSLDELKPRLNIPILLLHECAITASAKELSPIYKDNVIEFHKGRATAYFKKQLKSLASTFKYEDIKFHVILFPVPSKSAIIATFCSDVAAFKAFGK